MHYKMSKLSFEDRYEILNVRCMFINKDFSVEYVGKPKNQQSI